MSPFTITNANLNDRLILLSYRLCKLTDALIYLLTFGTQLGTNSRDHGLYRWIWPSLAKRNPPFFPRQKAHCVNAVLGLLDALVYLCTFSLISGHLLAYVSTQEWYIDWIGS